jgi:hypothetical protein
MARSTKKSITVPNPVREGLNIQIERGILDYPSENAAWIGLARYQLLVGKPHPVTVGIARMHQEDQDTIDDFLLEIATLGLTLKGRFLSHLIRQTIHGVTQPTEQEVERLVPQQLLDLARKWRKQPEEVIAQLEERKD